MKSAADHTADHVVLLGDSIFDNGVYVPGEPDVVHQLRTHLGDGWKATLLAVDGAMVEYGATPEQSHHFPPTSDDAYHSCSRDRWPRRK